jgi:hypothetical protein
MYAFYMHQLGKKLDDDIVKAQDAFKRPRDMDE